MIIMKEAWLAWGGVATAELQKRIITRNGQDVYTNPDSL